MAMRVWKNKKLLVSILLLAAAAAAFGLFSPGHRVDFSTEVKPILNKHCIVCHGGVKAKGGFSLLFRDDALAATESGKPAILPGDPAHSEMIRRLTLKDTEDRMPYHHEPLTPGEIGILTAWIRQGAPWGDNWSYIPVRPVTVPRPTASFFGLLPAKQIPWAKNDIDYFIWQRLQQEHLTPSSAADKPTLLRRVSLDLTGLLPSDALARQYLSDDRPAAYEKLVDSLLASPHFGERWASMWLDLARYADTKGYEADRPREIWRYRDWLIHAFNADKPYDQFLTEQIAGDLLPHPTDADYIATAFHRNTMTNDEGGTDDEEFRVAAVLDRVNTTWEALMGTTFACVQCHSHPYDPFRHDEYYQFMAYFNNTRDEDKFADYPLLRSLGDTLTPQLDRLMTWVRGNASPKEAIDLNHFVRTWQPSVYAPGADQSVELNRQLAVALGHQPSYYVVAQLKNIDLNNKTRLIYRYRIWAKHGRWLIHIDKPDGPILTVLNNRPTKDWEIDPIDLPVTRGFHDLYVVHEDPDPLKPTDNGIELDWFHFTGPFPGKDRPGYDSAKTLFYRLVRAQVPTTPVMFENPGDMRRVSHVFERGNWLTQGKIVKPAVPRSLSFAMPAGAPANRLGLAMWLTDKRNPLVSRTMVNRLWEQLFGTGIAETLEDLGTQGIPPTHRDLLDWMSWQFMNDYHWSIKTLLKEMVMSATYRQDSRTSEPLQQKDPFNKLYARGPRVRLSAEEVRDQALCASGMLDAKLCGPSVFPYQPKGIWQSPYNGEVWRQSTGGDQYRRALYTFWKRTAPYPSMISFDATSREGCTARRILTNTPLQALVTLNDSAYIDLDRHFAARMQRQAPGNPARQIDKGYEDIFYRPIEPAKLNVLLNLYDNARRRFGASPDDACEMGGGTGDHPATPDYAALTVVANALLNLDEVITKN